MRIVIATASLCKGRGGSERAAVQLAHEMLHRGHSVFLYAYAPPGVPAYPVEPEVQCRFFQLSLGEHAHIEEVRRTLRQDNIDIFVSFQSTWAHMVWALCCLGTGVPFICSERSDPLYSQAVTWNKPGRYATLYGADAIHELLSAHAESVPAALSERIHVIPNAVERRARTADLAPEEGRLTILFLGRYIGIKRADLLLKAFDLLAADFPRWDLRLVGHGREQEHLTALAESLPSARRIRIEGATEHPENDFLGAQIYCLPTAVEGFPNTVLEAMSCGLPIVGIRDCPAMRSIIDSGRTGLLAEAPTPEALAAALRPLMADAGLRVRMGENALEEVRLRYDASHVFEQWEQLLLTTAASKGHTVMDRFAEEPFASRARLSSVARREWLFRDFGEPMPYSCSWFRVRCRTLVGNIWKGLLKKCGGTK